MQMETLFPNLFFLVFANISSQVRSINFLVYLMWKNLCKHALSICRMNKQQFLALL